MMTMTSSFSVTRSRDDARLVAGWLLTVAFLVFCMVVLGGVTRLTESGLSMVEWRPVTGWLPPLTEQAWDAEFEKYKAFPEYQKVNKGMSLSAFKEIYAFEYGHRLLGRIIGLAFFVPFVLLLIAGRIRLAQVPRLLMLFVLGGSQGLMGWVMVKSGLIDQPDVSHYRLTAHLALASLILAALLWSALDLLYPGQAGVRGRPERLVRWSRIVLALIGLQILIGGFVAGLKAGLIYNEWPLMGGQFVPEDIFHMTPWYMNFMENVATIQFTHRMVAYAVTAAVILLFLFARKPGTGDRARAGITFLLFAVLAQVLIGIWTLITVVPVSLGALHQGMGMIVLALAVSVVHELSAPR